MSKNKKLIILLLISFVVLILAMGIGSVSINPVDTANLIIYKLFGKGFSGLIEPTTEAILWNIRFPRALLAFIAGAGLAISGVIMQSVLRNPLAASSTMGVASGAALGASLTIVFKLAIFGVFTLQVFGLTFGLITVFLAIGISAKVDRNLQNNSIILMGMAFSFFANSMLTIFLAFAKEDLQKLVFWQLGSFALKGWIATAILFPVVLIGFLFTLKLSREMDIMTFGDEQAQTTGIEIKKLKLTLLSLAAILTGSIVSMVGIIGFIDLFTPHLARKLFGSNHKFVLPGTALIGGLFMVLCDLVARTIVAPIELPVGAITSSIGAPFFIYLYFSKRKV